MNYAIAFAESRTIGTEYDLSTITFMHVVKLRDLGAASVNIFDQRYIRNLSGDEILQIIIDSFLSNTLTLTVTIDGYSAAFEQNLFHLHGGKMQDC
ncbi:hypothetical protein D3C76_1612300 [compost metagenome]